MWLVSRDQLRGAPFISASGDVKTRTDSSHQEPDPVIGSIGCQVSDVLPDWLRGDVSSADRATIEAHVAGCESCQVEVRVLTLVKQAWARESQQVLDIEKIVASLPAPSRPIERHGAQAASSRRRTLSGAWPEDRLQRVGKRVGLTVLSMAAAVAVWFTATPRDATGPRADLQTTTATQAALAKTGSLLLTESDSLAMGADPDIDPLLDLLIDLGVTLQ